MTDQNDEQASPRNFKIGQVYYMNFQSCEHGQRGWRPGVICQNNVANKYSPNIIAIPLTTVLKRTNMPTHVTLDSPDSGLSKTSMALCENLQYISKDSVGRYITTLPEVYMQEIAKAAMKSMALIAFLSVDEMATLRDQAIRLNNEGSLT